MGNEVRSVQKKQQSGREHDTTIKDGDDLLPNYFLLVLIVEELILDCHEQQFEEGTQQESVLEICQINFEAQEREEYEGVHHVRVRRLYFARLLLHGLKV
jgi:hypothetical protein